MKKPIAIFTMVWGEEYTEFYNKYMFPSMMLPDNLPKLLSEGYTVHWHIYSLTPPKYNNCMIHHPTISSDLHDGFRDFIKNNKNSICVIVCPDFIIGNGTLYNGIKIVEDKEGQCLSVANARISQEKMPPIVEAKTNAQLVDFAFRYGHKCLIETCDYKDPNLTWVGLSWRQIDHNNFAVVHNIATPWVMQLSDSDIDIFMDGNLGQFDRGFLEKLLSEGRIKVCGSSDLCFFAEITSDKRSPTLRAGLRHNDRTAYEELGRNYFNSTIINWRKE